jgi:hypothetical protein
MSRDCDPTGSIHEAHYQAIGLNSQFILSHIIQGAYVRLAYSVRSSRAIVTDSAVK